MTEEITTNEIDVSKCEYSFKQFDNWTGNDIVLCDCTLGYRCEPKENHCKFYMHYLEQQLKCKEQECEELKGKNQHLINTYCHFKNETKKYKKAVHKYKVVLQDKIERLHLSRREFLKEINSISKRIACNNEDFRNALNNFNNAIQVINNEDNCKQVLDEIEESASKHCISADDYNKIRNNKWVYAFSKGYATARWELINPILNIINKAKERINDR